MKVLIDTNIVLDAILERKPYDQSAQRILLKIAEQEIEGYITSKQIADLHYIIRKNLHNEEATRKLIRKIIFLFRVLNTTREDCILALESNIKDYEDALLVETASRHSIDVIITRNGKDFIHSAVDICDPKEFPD